MKDKHRPSTIFTGNDTPYVAIIGAGPAGLVSARWAVAHGLVPVIFDKNKQLGGQWHPKSGAMWDAMRTNLSKFTCMFSDLPWPEDAAMFPSQDDMYKYLCSYADKFNLHEYMRLNTEVTELRFQGDSYTIYLKGTAAVTCKHVIIAAGFYSKPYNPVISNESMFNGKTHRIIHSSKYKDLDLNTIAGKRVAIVGNGFSAAEIASNLAANGTKVIHVVDKPHWVVPRNLTDTKTHVVLPLDLIFYKRSARKSADEVIFKDDAANQATHKFLAGFCPAQNSSGHPLYIDPNSTEPAYVSVADGYIRGISESNIQVMRGKVQNFTQSGFKLDNDTYVAKIDLVIFCTGFRTKLSFPIVDISVANNNDLKFSATDQLQPFILYNGMLYPTLPFIAFVGMYRGPYFATMELQARWACMLFSGEIPYPTPDEIEAGLKIEEQIRKCKPRPQFPRGDYVGYTDALARKIGCLPDLAALKDNDPELYAQLWEGPALPTHYRLTGPHADPRLFAEQHRQAHDLMLKPSGSPILHSKNQTTEKSANRELAAKSKIKTQPSP